MRNIGLTGSSALTPVGFGGINIGVQNDVDIGIRHVFQ
jgi:hypothetical protein